MDARDLNSDPCACGKDLLASQLHCAYMCCSMWLPMPVWSAVHMHTSAEAKSWFLASCFMTLHLRFWGSFSFSQELAIWLSWLASKARRYCCLCSSPSSVLTGVCRLTRPQQVCSESEFISSYLYIRHFAHWGIPSSETSFFKRQ